MQPEKNTGTYKRPEPDIIAYIVKQMRTNLEWKQFTLADEAGVTGRTIERIEAGERVSDDTLNKIAKALKLRENTFTEPRYCHSAEELEEMAKKAKEDYTTTELHDLTSEGELETLLDAHAHLVDGSAVDESMAENIAALKDHVQDCGDIYSDVPHTSRLEFRRYLLGMIREIKAGGYTARWGRYRSDDGFNTGVLVFLKTPDLQKPEHFRHIIVPRSLMRSLAR